MLGDDDAPTRAAAVAALGHLGHWPAAARIAERLGDPDWEVRRQAALALRGMGAVGTVLLRRALRVEDRFSRDMATLALDLPDAAVTA
jgi:HEAT repeat protein